MDRHKVLAKGGCLHREGDGHFATTWGSRDITSERCSGKSFADMRFLTGCAAEREVSRDVRKLLRVHPRFENVNSRWAADLSDYQIGRLSLLPLGQ
jgi:hypothetical protein